MDLLSHVRSALRLLPFLALTLPAIGAAPGPTDPEAVQLADDLIGKAGVDRGICLVLGCGEGWLPVALARQSELLIHVIDPDADRVAATRRRLDEQAVSGSRVMVEQRGTDTLPHADNLLDAVFCVTRPDEAPGSLAVDEISRVLRPRGRAIVGRIGRRTPGVTGTGEGRFRQWASDAGFHVDEDHLGLWAQLTKPVPKQVDDWSHWQHAPDNNPFSDDRAIQAPYLTQFLAEPYHSPMPSISVIAGGRMFRAAGHMAIHQREERDINTLFATSAYNGTLLWTRPLPTGSLVHRSMLIATPDALYLAEGPACLVLDPQTGREKRRIDAPDAAGAHRFWRWMALEDGVLYALFGGPEMEAEIIKKKRATGAWGWDQLSKGYYTKKFPWGYGHTVVAIDLASGAVLWSYRADKPVDSRAMCMAAGRIFLHSEGHFVAALDSREGKLLWSNDDPELVSAIAEPRDHGLGFKTTPYAICTDEDLFFGGRGRRNVVGVSAADGQLRWVVPGAYNATNLLFQAGRLFAHLTSCIELDPKTGRKVGDLGIAKRSCARLTGCPDSLFHRGSLRGGEGTTRYDLVRRSATVIHAFRPPCNDGIIPAGGLLHVTPWDCDCNLQLVGTVALASAGEFEFGRGGSRAEALLVEPSLEVGVGDWPTYRGDNERSAATSASLPTDVTRRWLHVPTTPFRPSPPTAAGGLVLLAGSDGTVRAIDAATGRQRWRFHTAGPVRLPPTIADGRALVGSGDGNVYALDAATGVLLWRFHAAPVERRIPVYGALCSTWPVNSGVLVHDGVAYAAAGIINYDGTHVYALDARTGSVRWQNNTSGHLNEALRCGVSVQGNLTLLDDKLWIAGGNVTSPAAYDLGDGRCLNPPPDAGWPTGQRGSEIASLLGESLLIGGRRLYTQDDDPVVNWLGFEVFSSEQIGARLGGTIPGRVPPAFGSGAVAVSTRGPLVCLDADTVRTWLQELKPDRKWQWKWHVAPKAPELAPRWQSDTVVESVAVAIAANAIVTVGRDASRSRWIVQALDLADGRPQWTEDLPAAPLPGGLCVDAEGRCFVVLDDGRVVCLAE